MCNEKKKKTQTKKTNKKNGNQKENFITKGSEKCS